MKKAIIILLLAVFAFSAFSCGEKESPPASLPEIRYNGVPLQVYRVNVYKTNGEIAVGGNETAADHVKENAARVPYTEISDGKIELVNGSDKNVSFNILFSGVFDENGELLGYTENALSTLPAGRYIICAQVSERKAQIISVYIYMAGIDKK